MGFELTTLVGIGTDCIGSVNPYDHDHNDSLIFDLNAVVYT